MTETYRPGIDPKPYPYIPEGSTEQEIEDIMNNLTAYGNWSWMGRPPIAGGELREDS